MDHYRLKDPYCLWVPEDAPDGDDDHTDGHKAWSHYCEDGSEELRVAYWLDDQSNRDAHELEIVVVDPDLSEQAAKSGPRDVGVMHGEPDGIKLYEFPDNDLGGTWRVIWTGADECGPRSPHRRTHDHQRMLAANKKQKRLRGYVIIGPDHADRVDEANAAWMKLVEARYSTVDTDTDLDTADNPVIQAKMEPSHYFHFSGHGWAEPPTPNGDWHVKSIKVAGADPRLLGMEPRPPIAVKMDWRVAGMRHAHLCGCSTAVGGSKGTVNIAYYFHTQRATSSAGTRAEVNPSDALKWINTYYGYAVERGQDGRLANTISEAITDACECLEHDPDCDSRGYQMINDTTPGMKFIGTGLSIADR